MLALALPASASALRTGIVDPAEPVFRERDLPGAYRAARAAGLTVVRLPVVWGRVAPAQPADPGNPADPAYDWTDLDRRVRDATAAGLEPIVSVYSAPGWARSRGPRGASGQTPPPADFAAFIGAAARRYSGRPGAATRVRLWQFYNEPNLRAFFDQGPGAAANYRRMVNAAAPAVHAVHASNVVIAGGLAPFGGSGESPLRFMRKVLARRVEFDAWSMHPYTGGGPAHSALNRDDVSLGDLAEVRRTLRRAERSGRIRSRSRVRFWVTEFSWDTRGPDPWGVPLREHGRWVSEALYRMWRNGIGLVVWFQLRDNPPAGRDWFNTFQSGLYLRTTRLYARERAKPALRAIRFPFVALPQGRGVRVWGRTPAGRRASVAIERRSRGRWRRVATLRARRDGVFTRRLRLPRRVTLRARVAGRASPGFTARRTKDRLVNPFGGPLRPR